MLLCKPPSPQVPAELAGELAQLSRAIDNLKGGTDQVAGMRGHPSAGIWAGFAVTFRTLVYAFFLGLLCGAWLMH